MAIAATARPGEGAMTHTLLARAIPDAMKPSATVFIVDDEYFVRSGLRAVLESAGWTVIDYDGCEAFLAAYRPASGACLVLDAHMPGMEGLQLLDRLREAHDELPIVMISGSSDIATAVAAIKRGAQDFFEKPVVGEDLVAAVERALRRASARDGETESNRAAAASIARLTERQLEVMNLVVAGCPSKVIAFELGVSQRTVETHRAAIMRRTGAASIPELARLVSASMRFVAANAPA